MSNRLSAAAMRHLYEALLAPGGDRYSSSGAATMRQIASKGWAFEHNLEDIVLASDRRLSGFGYGVKPEDIGNALGIPQQRFCHRPRSIATGAVLYDGWTAFDAARILIVLEDLGFGVDPRPLVEALAKTVPKRGLVPYGALDVIWYARTRGKSKVKFQVDDPAARPAEYKDHTLPRGYKLAALLDREGAPISLEVRGPKYRKRADPYEVKCEQCGLTWFKGDPESSAWHRRDHKERMKTLDPQPHQKVQEERAAGDFDELVNWLSPEWRHKEMYARALAFKRELHFDFVQWDCPDTDRKAQGFLLADDASRIVGVCAFRYREYTDAPAGWALQFVWIAPPHRRSGVLAARWPTFRQRFGDFHIEGPVSQAMQAFARKMGDERLMFGSDEAYAKFKAERKDG